MTLSDKYAAELLFREARLDSVSTVYRVQPGEHLDENHLFRRQSLFVKPATANAMRGCALLEYNSETDDYSLHGKGLDGHALEAHGADAIIHELQKILLVDCLLIPEGS